MLLKKVVIGYSLESAMYAFLNGYHHVQSTTFQPLFFEETSDLTLWGTNNRRQIWQKVKMCLGFLSLSLDYPDIKQIRIEGNTLKLFDDSLLAEYEFEECYIYEPLNISHENKVLETNPEVCKVVDDFTVVRLGRDLTHIDPARTEDQLLSEIYFYNSMRVDGSKVVTDIATVSYLSRDQLYSFDYSDTMASFKLKRDLNAMGYIGLKEKHKNKDGTDVWKKLRLSHLKRYVVALDKNRYEDTENVKFVNFTTKELFDGTATEG